MKNLHLSTYLLAMGLLGLLVQAGCAKEDAEAANIAAKNLSALEQKPEEIKVEILLKDERKQESLDKTLEQAPNALGANQAMQQGTCQAKSTMQGAQYQGYNPYSTTLLPECYDAGAPFGYPGHLGPFGFGPGALVHPYSPYFVGDIIEDRYYYDDDHDHDDDDDDGHTNDDDV